MNKTKTAAHRRWSMAKSVSIIVASALLLAGGATTLWLSLDAGREAEDRLVRAEEAYEKFQARLVAEYIRRDKERQEAESQKRIDEIYTETGYAKAGDGLYYRFADPAGYTCGYWDCAYVEVATFDGCPGGLYVEAAVTRGGTDIGMANHLAAATPPGGNVAALLEDVVGGDAFRVTKIDCY